MLNNHVKIAYRNLTRNKAFSFINIFGLAAGLATCMLIMLYIFDELSYDRHHQNGDQLFRIASKSMSKGSSKEETWAAVSAPVAAGLSNDLPEVAQVTRLMTFPDIATMLLKYNHNGESKSFFESNGYYVDSSFFRLFTYDFIHGNTGNALKNPNSLVIAETLSVKFFGNTNPVGKSIAISTPFGEFNYTITGVFREGKYKSHIAANYFLSMHNNDMWNWVQQQHNWGSNNVFFTYVRLNPRVTKASFEKKLNLFFQTHAGAEIKSAGYSKTLFLQPVKDIYLHSAIGNEITPNGNIFYLYILGCIGAFILLIACINFMNLSTARSQKRAKEVGVRKVMGAEKSSLVGQFLGESFVMCLAALMLALLLVSLFLPLFNSLSQKQLQLRDAAATAGWITGLTLITGIFAGLYPAFYLSAFKPAAVLKGKVLNSFSAAAIRKGLVVFQFTVSICLIVAAIVIWQQLKLFQQQPLGFNKEHKLVLPLQKSYKNSQDNYTALRNELLKNPAIVSVTAGSAYPGVTNLNDMLFYAAGKTINDVVDIHLSAIENNYTETLGLTILSGRSFSKEFNADSAGILLNETAVEKLGYTVADAPGKKILYNFRGQLAAMQITGVVKNFNFESLHHGIQPYGFTAGEFANKYGYLIAVTNTSNYSEVLKAAEKIWSRLNPEIPFDYSFLDQDFQRNYQKEERIASIIFCFTIIAVLIACLGLFGLAAFSAEQRTKEIGIRKVLGATVTNVTVLLSKDFLTLVFIAMIIAFPAAWYGMTIWLQDFAYKTGIHWWIFLTAGLLAIVIALCSISFQAIKAAVANPVKSLRTE